MQLGKITVDPDGAELSVDIDADMAWTTSKGNVERSLPATVSAVTDFWLPRGRSYEVVSSLGDVEVDRRTVPLTTLVRPAVSLGEVQSLVNAGGGGGGSGTSVQQASVTIGSADLASFGTTPIELVAAPGAGKMLVGVIASLSYIAGDTPFDTDPAVTIDYEGTSYGLAQSTAMALDGTVSRNGIIAFTGERGRDVGTYDNKAFVVHGDAGSDPSGDGNGSLIVALAYLVFDTA